MGCKSFSSAPKGPPSLKNLIITSDKEGKVETKTFKTKDKIYVRAEFSGDMSNIRPVLYFLNPENKRYPGTETGVVKDNGIVEFETDAWGFLSEGKYPLVAELYSTGANGKAIEGTKLIGEVEIVTKY